MIAAPIEHVVVLMMENAGFDRMLGGLAAARPGLDGVDPGHPGTNPDGAAIVAQHETTTRHIVPDPRHFFDNSIAQYAGGSNQGFIADFVHTHPQSSAAERAEVMGYYPRGFLPALHYLGEQFVVCDRWFASLPGPTWMNRLFAHSGTSMGEIEEPGFSFTAPLHLYGQRTVYDELSALGVSWRVYYGDVPQVLTLTRQWRHLDRLRRYRHFHDDLQRGELAAYTFIEPTYYGAEQNDQHPPHDIMRGDALIADVYNRLLAAPQLFARTLLIVLYDEHGGFYDHVAPPATVAPDAHTRKFSFELLGFRVPALLISPMLDPGLVHAVCDHTSLLRMAQGLWGVAPLGARARQAHDPLAGLAWRGSPRTDLRVAPVAPDIRPVRTLSALEGFKASLYGLTHHMEMSIGHPETREDLRARFACARSQPDQASLAVDRARGLLNAPGTVI